MAEIKNFDADAKCDVCGHDHVEMRYVGPIGEDPCWYDRKYKPIGKWPETEYLHRTCARCGNQWPERTLRAALNQAPE